MNVKCYLRIQCLQSKHVPTTGNAALMSFSSKSTRLLCCFTSIAEIVMPKHHTPYCSMQ